MTTRAKVFIAIGAIVLLLIVLFVGARIWVDVLWFKQLSYLQAYTTVLFTKLWLWFAGFFLFLIFGVLNFLIAVRGSNIRSLKVPRSSRQLPGVAAEMMPDHVEINRQAMLVISGVVLFFLAVILFPYLVLKGMEEGL